MLIAYTQQNLCSPSKMYLLYQLRIFICLSVGVTGLHLTFKYLRKMIDLDLRLQPETLTFAIYHKHF